MEKELRTVWCGNLSSRVSEDVLYELFLQAGPLEEVTIPKDRDSRPRAYAFVTFKHIESVDYALELFKGTALYNRELCIDRKVGLPPPQPIQQPELFMPFCNRNPSGIIVPEIPLPFGINMYPVPYGSPDQFGYQGPMNMYPTNNNRRNSSRQHPYYRH